MAMDGVKRLAADILGVGVNKIRVKPDEAKRAAESLTRSDVKGLLNDGAVYSIEPSGRRKKEKKRKRGSARFRGRASNYDKKEWMTKLRSQRKYLKELLAAGVLNRKDKWPLYGRIKSGLFKNKKAMILYLKENDLADAKKLDEAIGKIEETNRTNYIQKTQKIETQKIQKKA